MCQIWCRERPWLADVNWRKIFRQNLDQKKYSANCALSVLCYPLRVMGSLLTTVTRWREYQLSLASGQFRGHSHTHFFTFLYISIKTVVLWSSWCCFPWQCQWLLLWLVVFRLWDGAGCNQCTQSRPAWLLLTTLRLSVGTVGLRSSTGTLLSPAAGPVTCQSSGRHSVETTKWQ